MSARAADPTSPSSRRRCGRRAAPPGIGRTLVRRIVLRARANGVARLTATSLRENVAALKLLIGLGFQIRELGSVVALDLDLGALSAAA